MTGHDLHQDADAVRKNVFAVWLAVALLALGPAESEAQSPQDLLRAQKLYDEADKLEAGGDAAGALAKFDEAMAVVETAQLRLRAGRCQEKLGKLVEALTSYNRAVALSEEDAALNKVASERARSASNKVPKLALQKPSDAPANMVLKVDGNVVTESPVQVNPGEHEVTAEATGFQPFQKRVAARESDTVTVAIELVSSEKPKPGDSDTKVARVLPFVLIGTGAGLLGLSIGFGAYSAVAKSTAYDDLAGPAGCTPGDPPGCPWASRETAPQTPAVEDFLGKIDESNIFLGLAIASGVLAAGAGATGVALLLTGGEAPPATALPWFDEQGGGVSFVGRF